ncbi:MAG: vWA domain-containing protein [Candidatus Zixiibacteriota bacterium]
MIRNIVIFFVIWVLIFSALSSPHDSEVIDLGSIPVNIEDYRVWKHNLFDSPEEASLLRAMEIVLENDYLNIVIDTVSGNFEIGADPTGTRDFTELTYSWPGPTGTDWILFKIDDNPANNFDSDTFYFASDSMFILEWYNYYGVFIREELSIASYGGNQQAHLKVSFWPVDGSCHNVGFMKYFDTMLDSDDAAEIATSYGYTGISEIFFEPDIPYFWRAYEGGYPPSPGALEALGIIGGFETVVPDVFWYGSWPASSGLGWDDSEWLTVTGDPFGDSACMLKWYQRTVCAGDTISFATSYGIGELSELFLYLSHIPPDLILDEDNDVSPNPFGIEAIITNGGIENACSVSARIILPEGMILDSGDSIEYLGDLSGSGGSLYSEWSIYANPVTWGTTQDYRIRIDYNDCIGMHDFIEDTFTIAIPMPHYADINLTTCPDSIEITNTHTFKWQIDGEIIANPCSLYFSYCDNADTIYFDADSQYTWTAPEFECDACTLRVVAANDSGYWGVDTCVFDIFEIGEYTISLSTFPPGFPTIIDGDTISEKDVSHGAIVEIACPETILMGTTELIFDRWADGSEDIMREILVLSDTSFMAIYATSGDSATITLQTEHIDGPLAYIDSIASETRRVAIGDYVDISCDEEYDDGIYIWHFANWDDSVFARNRTIRVFSDTTITAIYDTTEAPEMFDIELTSLPSMADLYIMGDRRTSASYSGGSEIEIRAGYEHTTMMGTFYFYRWSDGNYDSLRTIELTYDTSLIAYYFPEEDTIDINLATEPVGGNTYINRDTLFFKSVFRGASVEIDCDSSFIFDDNRYVFDHWSDGREERNRTITAYYDTSLVAIYEMHDIEYFWLYLYTDPSGGTTYIDSSELDSMRFVSGSVVEISCDSIISIDGDYYYFYRWTDGSYDRTRNVVVLSDTSFMAEYISMDDPCAHTFDIRLTANDVDVVFVIDTTGSMGSYIDQVLYNLSSFAADINDAGYGYRFGLVTYGDGYRVWDADPTEEGNQMTESLPVIQAKISATGATGGNDGPETSLDAINAAINEYEWRIDAEHFLINVTNAEFCSEDYPAPVSGCCCNDSTSVNVPEVLNASMVSGVRIYNQYPEYIEDTYTDIFDSLSIVSDGGFNDSGPEGLAALLDDITSDMGEFLIINFEFTNEYFDTIGLYAELISDTCLVLTSPREVTIDEIPPYATRTVSWNIVDSLCEAYDSSFTIYYETTTGCADSVDLELIKYNIDLLSEPDGSNFIINHYPRASAELRESTLVSFSCDYSFYDGTDLYIFEQWSDSIIETSREILLLQDTSFTAEYVFNPGLMITNCPDFIALEDSFTFLWSISDAAISETCTLWIDYCGIVEEYSITSDTEFTWMAPDEPCSLAIFSIKAIDSLGTVYYDTCRFQIVEPVLLSLFTEPDGGHTYINSVLLDTMHCMPFDTVQISCSDTFTTGGQLYDFMMWEDGVEELIRSIVIFRDTSFTAIYELNTGIEFTNCPDSLMVNEDYDFAWTIDDEVASGPCSLYFDFCDGFESFYLPDSSFFTWIAPDISCESCTLSIVSLGSYIWRDTCIFPIKERHDIASVKMICDSSAYEGAEIRFYDITSGDWPGDYLTSTFTDTAGLFDFPSMVIGNDYQIYACIDNANFYPNPIIIDNYDGSAIETEIFIIPFGDLDCNGDIITREIKEVQTWRIEPHTNIDSMKADVDCDTTINTLDLKNIQRIRGDSYNYNNCPE